MADLFDYQSRYPHSPGHRKTATSKAGAESVKERAPTLREKVLLMLEVQPYGRTADEIAKDLNTSILSVRPRVSELLRLGKIFDSGLTRPNESGVQATVWKAYS